MSMDTNMTLAEGEGIDWGPKHEKQLRVIFLAAMLSVSTLGNSLALWKIVGKLRKSSERSRRSANPQGSRLQAQTSLLFLHLVLADCLATAFCMGGQLAWELFDQAWLSSNSGCKLFKFFQILGLTSSTFMLVAISLDRMWAIVKPLQGHISAARLAGATWLMATLPALPSLFLFHTWHKVELGVTHCVSKMYSEPDSFGKGFRKAYFFLVFSCVFLLPFLVTLLLYSRILHTLCTHGEPSPACLTERLAPRLNLNHNNGGEGRRTALGLIPRARTKVLGLSVAYGVTFLLTNTPYIVHELCIVFLGSSALGRSTVAVIGILPPLNSALNPFIYLAFISNISSRNCCNFTPSLLTRILSWTSNQQCPSSCSCSLHRPDPETLALDPAAVVSIPVESETQGRP